MIIIYKITLVKLNYCVLKFKESKVTVHKPNLDMIMVISCYIQGIVSYLVF